MRLFEFDQIWQARHRAVVLDYLANRRAREKPRKFRQIDRRLSVPRAFEDSPRAGAERVDVAGGYEVGRRRRSRAHKADCAGAVCRAYARGYPLGGVDGHGERRSLGVAVQAHHVVDSKLREPFARRRDAHEPAGEFYHRIYGFGRDFLRRDNHIALVFARFVVGDYHDFTLRKIGDTLLDAVEYFFLFHNRCL